MPWKECHVMDERLRFVARLLDGEKMAALCAEFGISARPATRSTTGTRTAACRRSPIAAGGRTQANRLPAPIEATIVRLKREYPGWGAPKIREKLRRQLPGPAHCPRSAPSTRCWIGTAWCSGADGAARAPGDPVVAPDRAQRALVCRLQGRVHARQPRYCYPLTITDFASRYR